MTAGSAPNRTEEGYLVVMRRFPQAEFSIRRLMNQSEAFRDMCEELAEAQNALAAVPDMPSEACVARRREWQEMVDRLLAEVAAALRGTTHAL